MPPLYKIAHWYSRLRRPYETMKVLFYNSFLPTLGPKEKLGKISGLGIAFGYGGPLFILPLAEKVANISTWLVFPFGGVAFFLFSLPLFIFLPEREPVVNEAISTSVLKEELNKFTQHFRNLKENKNLLMILLANFFAIDAVNTAIIFMTTYLENAAWLSLPDDIKGSHINKRCPGDDECAHGSCTPAFGG